MTAHKLLSRDAWIQACHFHDLTETEVLREVAARVKKVKATATSEKTSHPLVLLDLDSTLYEVGERTRKILADWAASSDAKAFPKLSATFEKLPSILMGYSLRDNFISMGIDSRDPELEAGFDSVKKFWGRYFFSNHYLHLDQPYPGAVEFTKHLYETGAEIVYLTGRDEPGMGKGTMESLLAHGFPWEVPRTHLLLKRAFEDADVEHKKNAAHYVREHGTLIASLENEPKNLVALYHLFPKAMHVFVETVCSDHECEAVEGLYRIKGFGQG